MGQDKAWRGTTNNHSHASQAAATAATHDNIRHEQQHKDFESVDPIYNTKERAIDKAISTRVASAQKGSNNASLREG